MTRIDNITSHVVEVWITESERCAIDVWYDALMGRQYHARPIDETEFTRLVAYPGVVTVDLRRDNRE